MLSRYRRRYLLIYLSFRAEGEILRTLAHEGSRNESRSAGLLSPRPPPPHPLPPWRVPHSPSILNQTVS